MSITDKRLTEIQARVDSVEFPSDEHLAVVNGEENLVSWVERSRRDGSVVSGAVVATVHAGPRSAEMFAHAPEDLADLLAEVHRLKRRAGLLQWENHKLSAALTASWYREDAAQGGGDDA